VSLFVKAVEDRIEPREILHLTVVFDHDVIGGYGLGEDQSLTALDTEPTAVRTARVPA
jgi:hypothetical protein